MLPNVNTLHASLEDSLWAYAVDAAFLYVPLRCLVEGDSAAGCIGVGRAHRTQVDAVQLSPESVQAAFIKGAERTKKAAALVFTQAPVWTAPLLSGPFRAIGATHLAGIGTWGYWVGARSEAEALSGLVGYLADSYYNSKLP